MLKKLTAIALLALLPLFLCVACAPEPVPPDRAGAGVAPSDTFIHSWRREQAPALRYHSSLASPEPVPPANAPTEPTPAPRSENITSRSEKARNAELGCSFAFILLAVSAFSMMGALTVCNRPDDEF